MNNQTLESYIVERVKKLENDVSVLEDERRALIDQLLVVDEMKAKMREYFKIKKYETGERYIDLTYNDRYVDEIIEFIGLAEECEQED